MRWACPAAARFPLGWQALINLWITAGLAEAVERHASDRGPVLEVEHGIPERGQGLTCNAPKLSHATVAAA